MSCSSCRISCCSERSSLRRDTRPRAALARPGPATDPRLPPARRCASRSAGGRQFPLQTQRVGQCFDAPGGAQQLLNECTEGRVTFHELVGTADDRAATVRCAAVGPEAERDAAQVEQPDDGLSACSSPAARASANAAPWTTMNCVRSPRAASINGAMRTSTRTRSATIPRTVAKGPKGLSWARASRSLTPGPRPFLATFQVLQDLRPFRHDRVPTLQVDQLLPLLTQVLFARVERPTCTLQVARGLAAPAGRVASQSSASCSSWAAASRSCCSACRCCCWHRGTRRLRRLDFHLQGGHLTVQLTALPQLGRVFLLPQFAAAPQGGQLIGGRPQLSFAAQQPAANFRCPTARPFVQLGLAAAGVARSNSSTRVPSSGTGGGSAGSPAPDPLARTCSCCTVVSVTSNLLPQSTDAGFCVVQALRSVAGLRRRARALRVRRHRAATAPPRPAPRTCCSWSSCSRNRSV